MIVAQPTWLLLRGQIGWVTLLLPSQHPSPSVDRSDDPCLLPRGEAPTSHASISIYRSLQVVGAVLRFQKVYTAPATRLLPPGRSPPASAVKEETRPRAMEPIGN